MPALQHYFTEYEIIIRLSCFCLLLSLFLLLELKCPRRISAPGTIRRRFNNLGLMCINVLAIRLIVPFAAVETAILAARNETGLFNLLSLPFAVNVLITVVLFDLLIYLQHVAFHKIPILWRIHRVHHTDDHVDVTTGIRFHPFEIFLSMAYKSGAVYLLGPAAFAIMLYEILLSMAALFTHSNILLRQNVDLALRSIFVTPDMHCIHHSVVRTETDSNYGNLFSCWDKLFKTYRSMPAAGYNNILIGLNEFRDQSSNRLFQLLKNPFLFNR